MASQPGNSAVGAGHWLSYAGYRPYSILMFGLLKRSGYLVVEAVSWTCGTALRIGKLFPLKFSTCKLLSWFG